MEMYAALRRYAAALRQRTILATAYPALPELSALWLLLPEGRPAELSAAGRYVLFAFRAADAEAETWREWLLDRDLDAWVAATEAETRYLWQREWPTLPMDWAPRVPDFIAQTTALAVA